MSKTIENLKSGNYEVIDNQGVSVTINFVECLEKEFADLEAKLAESEEDLKATTESLYASREYLDQLKSEKWALEKQLAEKEKAYQELLNSIKIKDLSNINFIQVNDDVTRFSESGVIYEYNKKDNTIYKIIDKSHQDKISFCIEKLEKVKWIVEDIQCACGDDNNIDRDFLIKEIDYQIEELKNGEWK